MLFSSICPHNFLSVNKCSLKYVLMLITFTEKLSDLMYKLYLSNFNPLWILHIVLINHRNRVTTLKSSWRLKSLLGNNRINQTIQTFPKLRRFISGSIKQRYPLKLYLLGNLKDNVVFANFYISRQFLSDISLQMEIWKCRWFW